jgi:hypothetical protein
MPLPLRLLRIEDSENDAALTVRNLAQKKAVQFQTALIF